MLNEKEYSKLTENVKLISEYLKSKLDEIREPIKFEFGEDYIIHLGIENGVQVSTKNGRVWFKFENPVAESSYDVFTTLYAFRKQTPACEQMMIQMILNWNYIKLEIESQLRNQRYIRRMIEEFKI